MIQNVEVSSFDLRYEDYRIKNKGSEQGLLVSIIQQGICDPLEGVDTENGRILLNGFKRLRCALKLKIGIVPYSSFGTDEAIGIIQLLKISNAKSLNILEQAKMIDDLKNVHNMSILEIAEKLERSKGWVSMRIGLIGGMSECVSKKIFKGLFPVYSYMYVLRQFIRMNCTKPDEIDEFVNLVSGKNLSIRDIEQLAYGFFKGPDDFREQMRKGNINWALQRLREASVHPDDCTELERSMLNDLEIIQKYMKKVMNKSADSRFKNDSFFAQANLLAGGILSKVSVFTKTLRSFYDRSGQKKCDISSS